QARWLRIRIAAAAAGRVGRIGPRAFVGVEPYLAAHVAGARRGVAAEAAQVLAHQRQQRVARRRPRRVHADASCMRSTTALACASSCSARARVTAQAPMASRPSRLAACTLTAFWKLPTLTPLHARAAPLVGNTWLVPLQ